MKKVTAVIQARTTSERLPSKVLMPLGGKPVIEHVINAISNATLVDEVIMATTSNASDDEIAAISEKMGLQVIRGSEHDVLSRFAKAAEISNAEVFCRFTADDPLLDPNVIDTVVGGFLKYEYDYVSNIIDRSWPRGLDTEVFSREALLRSVELAQEADYKEHVTLYIRMHQNAFSQANIKSLPQEHEPDLRLCVDTEEDYALLKHIFDNLYMEGKILRVGEVLNWLRANPDIMKLNAEIKQKPVFGKVF